MLILRMRLRPIGYAIKDIYHVVESKTIYIQAIVKVSQVQSYSRVRIPFQPNDRILAHCHFKQSIIMLQTQHLDSS